MLDRKSWLTVLTWCFCVTFWKRFSEFILDPSETTIQYGQPQRHLCRLWLLATGDLDGNEDADGLDGDEDEVAAVLPVRVVSALFLLDMMVPRRVQFVELNQYWRTGTFLVRLNLDIHEFWNVIMPYSKKFIGDNSFCEVLFSRRFWRCETQQVLSVKRLLYL